MTLSRQLTLYILLSILAVFLAPYLGVVVHGVQAAYKVFYHVTQPVFSDQYWGKLLQKVVILVFLPLFIAAAFSWVYQFIAKQKFAYFIALMWSIWLVLFIINLK